MEAAIPIALVILAIAAIAGVYNLRQPRVLPTAKPTFVLFPKYRVPIELPQRIIQSSTSVDDLAKSMSWWGFRPERMTGDYLRFTRGSAIGDFSTQFAKINVTFPVPFRQETEMWVEAATLALFDTGDLWLFSHELKQHIERLGGKEE